MKMLIAVFFALALLATLSANADTGFDRGNKFEFQGAVGDVSVTCFSSGAPRPYPNPGPNYARYRCSGESFSPNRWATFTGPKIDADEIELTATHADGSTRTKSSSYDKRKGASKESFNLWVYTLFQRPLLHMGRNDVQWTLKKKGKLAQQGTFVAEVFDRGDLQCPFASQTSFDPNDCRSSTNVCNNYFQQYGHLCR